jgi:hypothetical protein
MPFLSSRAAGSVRGYGFGSAKAASVLTGGTLSSDATHNYRAFTASGSFVVSGVPLEAEILMIGGGGNSISTYPNAGGGAGQVISYNNTLSTGTYTCTVGSAGSNSTVSVINRTAVGGGNSTESGIGGTSGNGFAGGLRPASPGSGGGGATAVGGDSYQHPVYSNNSAGSGGAGTSAYSSFGVATSLGQLSGGLRYFGGGGGGAGGGQASGQNPGGGGIGGGGNGSFYAFWDGVNQTNNTYANHLNNQGQANCGGGAGGFFYTQTNGNSGLIIFKYLKGAGN